MATCGGGSKTVRPVWPAPSAAKSMAPGLARASAVKSLAARFGQSRPRPSQWPNGAEVLYIIRPVWPHPSAAKSRPLRPSAAKSPMGAGAVFLSGPGPRHVWLRGGGPTENMSTESRALGADGEHMPRARASWNGDWESPAMQALRGQFGPAFVEGPDRRQNELFGDRVVSAPPVASYGLHAVAARSPSIAAPIQAPVRWVYGGGTRAATPPAAPSESIPRAARRKRSSDSESDSDDNAGDCDQHVHDDGREDDSDDWMAATDMPVDTAPSSPFSRFARADGRDDAALQVPEPMATATDLQPASPGDDATPLMAAYLRALLGEQHQPEHIAQSRWLRRRPSVPRGDGGRSDCWLFEWYGPRALGCAHSGLQHTADEARTRCCVVVSKRVHTTLSMRTCCFEPRCRQYRGHSAIWRLPRSGKIAFAGSDKFAAAKWVDDDVKMIVQLQRSLFPDGARLDPHAFPDTSPLKEFRAQNNFGMRYDRYDEPHARPVSFSHSCLTFVGISGTGTGKTTGATRAVIDCARGLASDCDRRVAGSLIVLSTRQSLSRTIAAKLRECWVSTLPPHQVGIFPPGQLAPAGDSSLWAHTFDPVGPAAATPSKPGPGVDRPPIRCYLAPDLQAEPQRIREQLGVVISPDSSRHLFRADGTLPSPHLLWVDEFGAALKYLALSDTLNGKRAAVWDTVAQLIRSARNVLVTDADLDDAGLRVLSRLRDPATTLVSHNVRRTNAKQYLLTESFERCTQRIVADIRAERNVFVACDGAKRARSLHERLLGEFPGLRALVYHGRSTAAEKRQIGRCNTVWAQAQVVIVSPVVTYGVDFSPPAPHFHRVYGMFHGKTFDYQSAFQQLERIRHIHPSTTQEHVVVCMDVLCAPRRTETREQVMNGLAYCWDRLHASAQRSAADAAAAERRALLRTVFDRDGRQQLDTTDPFVIAYAAAQLDISRSRADFAGYLCSRIMESGGEVRVASPTDLLRSPTPCAAAAVIASDASAEAKWIAGVVAAPFCSASEGADLLKRRNLLEDDDQLRLERFEIGRTLGWDTPEKQAGITADLVLQLGPKTRPRYEHFIHFETCYRAGTQHVAARAPSAGTDVDRAVYSARFDAINTLCTATKTVFGADCCVSHDTKLSNDGVASLQAIPWGLLFGDSGRIRFEDKSKRIDWVKLLSRVCNDFFPPGVCRVSTQKRARVHLPDAAASRRVTISTLKWDLDTLRRLLSNRLAPPTTPAPAPLPSIARACRRPSQSSPPPSPLLVPQSRLP